MVEKQTAPGDDEGRGGEAAVPSDPAALFAGMFERLSTDRLGATEYEDFVRQVSFADRGELIDFSQALDAFPDLVALLGTEGSK